MSTLEYRELNKINPLDFIPILNEDSIRNHLIDHDVFNTERVQTWVAEKMKCDVLDKCRIRGVYLDEQVMRMTMKVTLQIAEQ